MDHRALCMRRTSSGVAPDGAFRHGVLGQWSTSMWPWLLRPLPLLVGLSQGRHTPQLHTRARADDDATAHSLVGFTIGTVLKKSLSWECQGNKNIGMYISIPRAHMSLFDDPVRHSPKLVGFGAFLAAITGAIRFTDQMAQPSSIEVLGSRVLTFSGSVFSFIYLCFVVYDGLFGLGVHFAEDHMRNLHWTMGFTGFTIIMAALQINDSKTNKRRPNLIKELSDEHNGSNTVCTISWVALSLASFALVLAIVLRTTQFKEGTRWGEELKRDKRSRERFKRREEMQDVAAEVAKSPEEAQALFDEWWHEYEQEKQNVISASERGRE